MHTLVAALRSPPAITRRSVSYLYTHRSQAGVYTMTGRRRRSSDTGHRHYSQTRRDPDATQSRLPLPRLGSGMLLYYYSAFASVPVCAEVAWDG